MNLEYVKSQEGELISVVGKYKCQDPNKAFSTHELVLKDGTRIVLVVSSYNDVDNIFTSKNHNKRLEVVGRVYVDEIPERYNIISRTDDPYMVEIEKAALYKRD
ncbi:MAG: hypothetical protein NXI10_16475 [bacterium]|nr:hypothetical protein [bacterium]